MTRKVKIPRKKYFKSDLDTKKGKNKQKSFQKNKFQSFLEQTLANSFFGIPKNKQVPK